MNDDLNRRRQENFQHTLEEIGKLFEGNSNGIATKKRQRERGGFSEKG
jgi:hypothetical protein